MPKTKIKNLMSQPGPPLLKTGQGSKTGSWYIITIVRQIVPCRLIGHDLEQGFGIIKPVGGDIQQAAMPGSCGQLLEETVVEQTAFVMTLFWPGVRKKNTDLIQRINRYQFAEELVNILVEDGDIVELMLSGPQQTTTESWLVDFGTDKKAFRPLSGHGQQGFPITKADFQYDRDTRSALLCDLFPGDPVFWQ